MDQVRAKYTRIFGVLSAQRTRVVAVCVVLFMSKKTRKLKFDVIVLLKILFLRRLEALLVIALSVSYSLSVCRVTCRLVVLVE